MVAAKFEKYSKKVSKDENHERGKIYSQVWSLHVHCYTHAAESGGLNDEVHFDVYRHGGLDGRAHESNMRRLLARRSM